MFQELQLNRKKNKQSWKKPTTILMFLLQSFFVYAHTNIFYSCCY